MNKWRADPVSVCNGSTDVTLYDADLKGFGLRIRQGAKGASFSWWIKYRDAEGRQVRFRLGDYPKLTVPQARELAAKRFAEITANNSDPAGHRRQLRESITVEQMCRDYLAAAKAGAPMKRGGKPKKASTLEMDDGRIERHIIPELGRRKAVSVTTKDVRAFMAAVRDGKTAADIKTRSRGRAIVKGGPTAAARAVGLLGGIYAWAIKELEVRPDNPCRGVERPADEKRDRRLNLDEYASFGAALDSLASEGENINALDMIRLIALTGLRRAEAMNLSPSEVDLKAKCLRLADSKTGASTRPLGSPAITILNDRAEIAALIFPGRGGQPLAGIPKVFGRITARANLSGVTIHTLRHSFASIANDLGMTESTIGAIIGHKSRSMTGRYIHNLDPLLIAAADKVARQIDDAMRSNERGKVVEFPGANRAG